MSETDLVQRVDSAEMADLFSQSLLLDGEDFLSPRKELTFSDVRHLRLGNEDQKSGGQRTQGYSQPGRDGRWGAMRGREPSSELDLRATKEEDSWLASSPAQKKPSIRRSNSVEEYLRLKDAARPSFSKRSTSSSVEAAGHVKPSSKGIDRLLGAKPSVNSASLSDRRSSYDSRTRQTDSPAYDYRSDGGRRSSVGSRRSRTPSPAPGMRHSLGANRHSGNDRAASCGRYADPPSSPCSSRASAGGSRTPAVRGRSSIPSPSTPGCRSAVSSPTNSDPRSSIPSPTPSSGSAGRGGCKDRISRPHSSMSCNARVGMNHRRSESPSAHSVVNRCGCAGSNAMTWSGGQGSESDLLSPKSTSSDYGRSRVLGRRDSVCSDEDEGITIGRRLFSRGLDRLSKCKAASDAQKGTRLKAKQEPRLSQLWKET